MYSVTRRIANVKQPRGGYLPIKDFEAVSLEFGQAMLEGESLSPGLAGMAVDYITRFVMGTDLSEAFAISLCGAELVNELNYAKKLMTKIKGLDDESIRCAVKLVGYDVAFRAGAAYYKDVRGITVTDTDIHNIRAMIERTREFWSVYGPVVKDGLTFEGGGYSATVSSGDADYLTKDALWDLKTTVSKPTSKHTLQILMYYIMGLHSAYREAFSRIQYIGFYNPRLNMVYRYNVKDIPSEVIKAVEDDVICYGKAPDVPFEVNVPAMVTQDEAEDDEELTVKDVAERYGISENKVRTDCFVAGLPHSKRGNRYIISRKAMLEWEREKAYIRIGHNGRRLLPGYVAYVEVLKEELAIAKQKGDKEGAKVIKREIKRLEAKIGKFSGGGLALGLLAAFVILFLVVLWAIVYH